ncbi:hypothetical protein MBEBAB_2944 [Brevundimonas abyssalis TAR-001]|uniref:Uncharacterized protein n=1 Tax=Brevundimonas abyssalis TAR-001 TaxID=1391729 RepID=A0A8E0NE84_9CAUL|nr:hypothetical protein MBEBAB_2944 [Brevundimonas abyssalis TAR-001]
MENTYKRGMGRMRALIDGDFMGRRQAAEEEFRARVAADPALAAEAGDPWSTLAEIQPVQARLYPAYSLLEGRAGGGSRLFGFAQTLVRAAQERDKPRDSACPSSPTAACRWCSSACLRTCPPIRRWTSCSSAGGCPRPARS